jgi:phosphatidylinositol glycan class O
MLHDYPSFNVEDLHTVDEGVIEHIFPLLKHENGTEWDFIIGHFLGVDHVGHRVGPEHSVMTAKLQQMDTALRDIVELLDDETLLVVMGDHGMNQQGDHGGDSELETSAALWFYSKSVPLSTSKSGMTSPSLMSMATYPGARVPHRFIPQIDLVPTLSLLLGLPIPFNNLGFVIPELFQRGSDFQAAMEANTRQIKTYLDQYRTSPSGGELDAGWENLEESYQQSQILTGESSSRAEAHYAFARTALETCRQLWAQFNMGLIVLGVLVMASAFAASVRVYQELNVQSDTWEVAVIEPLVQGFLGASFLAILISAMAWTVSSKLHLPISLAELAMFVLSFGAPIPLAIPTNIRTPNIPTLSFESILLVVYCGVFWSNSFVVWEERIVTFFLVSCILPRVIFSLGKCTGRLQWRLLGFSAVFLAAVRLMASSTICREEQHPYCHITFYASSLLPSPPTVTLLLIIPTALGLPTAVRHFLKIAAADQGLAPFYIEIVLRCFLVLGSVSWIIDLMDNSGIAAQYVDAQWATETIRIVRSTVGRIVAGGSAVSLAIWSASPLNIAVRRKQDASGKSLVEVIGFANTYGSFYLLFVLFFFAFVWLTTQISGQLPLALCVIAILAYLELIDTLRDIQQLGTRLPEQSSSGQSGPSFSEIAPLALLAQLAFFSTGHQAVISTLQWKTAFVLTATRSVFSPFTVVSNTLGPTFVVALAAPLLGMWLIPPLPQPAANNTVIRRALKTALGFSIYFSTLLLSSAASAAWFRRHLMVWKVFAPRFMMAGLSMLAVDVGLFVAAAGIATVLQNVRMAYKGVT